MSGINIKNIRAQFKKTDDIRYRNIECASVEVQMVYINSMCDGKYISDFMIRPLMDKLHRRDSLEVIMHEIIQADFVTEILTMEEAVRNVLSGNVLFIFPHLEQCISCEAKGFVKRAVTIPQTETVIKGPREGFTEDIHDNITAIRRHIRSPKLKVENYVVGSESQTQVAMLYIEDLAPKELLNFCREKINSIQKHFVVYSNTIETSLRCKWTPFDTIGYTEKPDVAVSKLSEGRVIIFVNGTPNCITAPLFFIENFQTADDYTLNVFMSNTGRAFRWIAFFLSTFVPGLYLALVTYHFRLVPNVFLYRLVLFRAGVPVPTIVELLYMILFFQLIREAGIRLPQPIGPTLSIVGALILGEAAVTTGLASQITVVIVAITSIAAFLIPVLDAATFVCSTIIIFLAGLNGLPGFYIGSFMLIAHLAGLTSCGYPYLFPLGTFKTFKYKDIIFRSPDMNEINSAPLTKDEN